MGMSATLVFDTSQQQEPANFLRLLAQHRPIFPTVFRISGPNNRNLVSTFQHEGKTFSLVATKGRRDKSGKYAYVRQTEIEFKYVATGGVDVPAWDPQDALEKIADFQSLPPHKVPSRLELLLTPAKNGDQYTIDRMITKDFEVLAEEDSFMGCGFIPDQFFTMEPFCNMSNANDIEALQVRVFAPHLGIAKGMLTRKVGIDKIQLPPSMIKVGPSRRCTDTDHWVTMIVKKTVPSVSNAHLGKYLDPILNPRPSFLKENFKPLSEMYV
jgi:hypothetical protein